VWSLPRISDRGAVTPWRRAQISQLTDLLALEKTGKVGMEDEIARLRASLSGTGQERDPLKTAAENAGTNSAQTVLAESQSQVSALNGALESEKNVSARALASKS
jgi:chemotaxis protein MotB